ncbi:MAG: hypothetical protein Q8R91_08095 [Candidatus Omnitrophota bacterium]|nr:hypothetical protein [Candidatus Omnitrophota bacterium]
MKQPLTLKVIFVLLAANIGLQFWRLSDLVPALGRWQQEQKQDLARWDEWERVGKAKVAAGSKTTFVPDPLRSESLRRDLTYRFIVLAVLVIAVSMISAIGLFMEWRWAYRLAIGYASIGVGWGLFELMPGNPSVVNYALYYWHDQGAAMMMLSRGLLLHGVMLYCLLRPAVKAQFVRQRDHGQMG